MTRVIKGAPEKVCPSCGCLFEYSSADVHSGTEEYWAGFWKGGWLTRYIRYVKCPGCSKLIKLK